MSCSTSYLVIFSILLMCFSSSENGVFINVSTISFACSRPIFSLNATIFESLSFLVTLASSLVSTFAQRIPFTLLHAILIPIPDPHIAIPKSTFLSTTFFPIKKA